MAGSATAGGVERIGERVYRETACHGVDVGEAVESVVGAANGDGAAEVGRGLKEIGVGDI
jgi:hypothetical protein